MYTYVTLPYEKLKYKYSLWVFNKELYIYLFDNKEELLECMEQFYIISCIAMDINLVKRLDTIIKTSIEYDYICEHIEKTQNLLRNNDIPEWEIFEEIEIKKNMSHTTFDINVSQIISQVETLFKLYSNDLKALTNLIQHLQIKLDNCKYNECIYEETIKVTDDNYYIFIDMNVLSGINGCNIFSCNRTTYDLQFIYLLVKPKNDNAIKLCNEMVNNRMIGKVHHLKEIIKFHKHQVF